MRNSQDGNRERRSKPAWGILIKFRNYERLGLGLLHFDNGKMKKALTHTPRVIDLCGMEAAG